MTQENSSTEAENGADTTPTAGEAGVEGGDTDTASDDAGDRRERMARALAQIRREGWKAAFIVAVVDAVALFLAANLLLSVVEPSWVPPRYPLPSAMSGPVGGLLGQPGRVAVPGTVVVAAGVGAVALTAGVWLRVRRPLVERFEAVNPPVTEALRTARDAVADGADSRMAARLYDDVLERLRGTSSLGLVDVRRVAVTLLAIILLSGATTQVAVYDVAFGGGNGPGTEGPTEDEDVEFSGLRDGVAVLGDPEEVSAGDENLSATVESTGGDQELDGPEQFPSGGGAAGGDGFDSQQAGFAQPEQIEDAELVRRYNIRIRQTEEN
jgi:hypothetical protein